MTDRKTISREMKNFKQETIEQCLTIEQRAKIYCANIPLTICMYNPNIEHYCYEGIVKVAKEVTKELNKKLSQAEADYDKMFWQKNEIISNLQEQIEKMKCVQNCKHGHDGQYENTCHINYQRNCNKDCKFCKDWELAE